MTDPSENRKACLYLLLIGVFQSLLYLSLNHQSIHSNRYLFSAIILISWGCFFVGYSLTPSNNHQRFFFTIIVIFALIYRGIHFHLAPIFSDDYLRYLFDGRLSLIYGNPYRGTPLDFPELLNPDMPKPDIGTIYPLLAQYLFYLSVLLGGNITSWKSLILIADLICILLLINELNHRSLPLNRMIAYLWNPLILKEFINSSHLDQWTLLFVLIFLMSWSRKKILFSFLALCAAIQIKLIPLILFLPWINSVEKHSKKMIYLCFASILIVLPYFPLFPSQPFGNVFQFYSHIEGNGLIFSILRMFVDENIARVILTSTGGFGLYILLAYTKRYQSVDRWRVLELLIVLFIFSTTGFPWYLGVLVPMVVIKHRTWVLLLMAGTQVIYYLPQSIVANIIVVILLISSFKLFCLGDNKV